MKKKIVVLLVTGILTVGVLAGCGSKMGSATQEKFAASKGVVLAQEKSVSLEDDISAQENKNYRIAGNTWGGGSYPLESIVNAEKIVMNMTGMDFNLADNNFTAEEIISDLKVQLNEGVDGVLMQCNVDPVFENMQKACDTENVPYVLDSNFPLEEDVFSKIKADPLFAGGVTCKPYDMGYQMGEQAIADGCQTAVICASNTDDYSFENRIQGFTDAFEKAGGKVLQTMYASNPSESFDELKIFMNEYKDVDCVYGTGGDCLSVLAWIKMDDASANYNVYGTDVTPNVLDCIENGVIVATNGGNDITGAIAACLLINRLDGHPVLDQDGKAPVLCDSNPYIVTQENVVEIKQLVEDGNGLLEEADLQKLLYRYNPEVSIETYQELMNR